MNNAQTITKNTKLTCCVDLPNDAYKRFANINSNLWTTGEFRPNISGKPFSVRVSRGRQLSQSEFEFILQTASEYHLPISIHSGEMGFGFEICIHSHENHVLCTFESKHVPDEAIPSNREGTRKDKVFDLMEPLFNSEENLQFLSFYKIEAPKSRNYYEY